MHRKEINERSPLRVLEKSIHGGLGRGNVGVVVARHGIGKTAFLVGVGLDDLMRAKQVFHLSMGQSVDRVCTYYDEILMELARERQMEDVWKVRLGVERNRRIHSIPSTKFSVDKVREALEFLREYNEFTPSAILIDDVDFRNLSAEDLQGLRAIARECDAELWMSAVTHREDDRDERGVPEAVARLDAELDVILTMAHDGTAVNVALHKDHDNPEVSDLRLALDPTTMLLIRP
jgi:hypothetical protein